MFEIKQKQEEIKKDGKIEEVKINNFMEEAKPVVMQFEEEKAVVEVPPPTNEFTINTNKIRTLKNKRFAKKEPVI